MNRLSGTLRLCVSASFLLALSFAQVRSIPLPSKSPLVNFKIVFTVGSTADPGDKPGLAYLTAHMLADAGSKELTYRQITEALFPMAAGVGAQVDKEMTTFSGTSHVETLDAYYKIFKAMLLDPGWREDDFRRVKDDAINAIKVGLRGNNDEELGKEVLYETIYKGTPYEHYSGGTVSGLEKITLDDVKNFYKTQYTQSRLVLGIAGGYPANFLDRLKTDFKAVLPVNGGFQVRMKHPVTPEDTRVVIVDKDTRSVAISIGYPMELTRTNSDYAALLLVSSYLGQHRMSSGVLYQRMRELRGLNYGDYAYVEYFPRGMFLMEPPQNVARHYQIFQVWIRPVEPPTAKFALRLAIFELDKLHKNGMTKEQFERTRDFLSKFVNVLTKSKRAELGYAIDSNFYGINPYNQYLKDQLAKLTLEDVNRVIKRFIRTDRLTIAIVAKNAEALKAELTNDDPSPMTYNSPKPEEVMEEDKIVERWPLKLKPEDITIRPVAEVFQ